MFSIPLPGGGHRRCRDRCYRSGNKGLEKKPKFEMVVVPREQQIASCRCFWIQRGSVLFLTVMVRRLPYWCVVSYSPFLTNHFHLMDAGTTFDLSVTQGQQRAKSDICIEIGTNPPSSFLLFIAGNEEKVLVHWQDLQLPLLARVQPLARICCLFVASRPKSTAMVIAGRSVHLSTLFPGQAWTSR